MNAEKARELTEKNQYGIENALKQIEASANVGESATILFNLKKDAVTELLKMGFSIREHKDPVNGMINTICSW